MKCAARASLKIQDAKVAQKIAIWAPSTTLSGYIFATKACIDNRKNLLSSDIPSTCPHNMVNFGLLAASLGHPSYFQRLPRFGSVTARQSSSERQPNFAALNRGATYVRQGDHHVGHWPTF